ncbi:MAG: tRNA (adenosine(37)-N6)-threonylcarbamoyltransferase complex transferase subunit TsaD [Candidatus Melainabacteria bacterium]|nr:tRNA (adenosine(37)-N6)-threonylcarbamoyltransferase complex transferase subunit TsaD [Candidatus Melainabacteria bacterium]
MLFLGLESSCDETAVAIVEDGRRVVAQRLISQIEVHRKFGGVVPEVAARRHLEVINDLVADVLAEAAIDPSSLAGIACTTGPGLIGTLLVGLSCAKALAWSYDVPLLSVDHIFAHVCANYIDTNLEPPFVALVVSGGHTQIMYFESYRKATILGQTLDDASGEAYDKVARLLGLGYPGGPAVDKAAARGNPRAFRFPEGVVSGSDFSFSGLKTAVLRTVENLNGVDLPVDDLAASFQDAVNRVLFRKTIAAARANGVSRVVLAGGVAANSDLRKRFESLADIEFYRPAPALCTDNAVMVAAAAFYSGEPVPLSVSAYSRQR